MTIDYTDHNSIVLRSDGSFGFAVIRTSDGRVHVIRQFQGRTLVTSWDSFDQYVADTAPTLQSSATTSN